MKFIVKRRTLRNVDTYFELIDVLNDIYNNFIRLHRDGMQ